MPTEHVQGSRLCNEHDGTELWHALNTVEVTKLQHSSCYIPSMVATS